MALFASKNKNIKIKNDSRSKNGLDLSSANMALHSCAPYRPDMYNCRGCRRAIGFTD